jgi:hypothetical protein
VHEVGDRVDLEAKHELASVGPGQGRRRGVVQEEEPEQPEEQVERAEQQGGQLLPGEPRRSRTRAALRASPFSWARPSVFSTIGFSSGSGSARLSTTWEGATAALQDSARIAMAASSRIIGRR